MKTLSLEELAEKFKQRGDTCALASMLFSAAMLYRNTSFIPDVINKDIDFIFSDSEGYQKIRRKITPPFETRRGLAMGPLIIESVGDYFVSKGYEVTYSPPDRESLIAAIESYPVVALSFNFPEWLYFYGSGTLNNWFCCHVVCALGFENNNITYFEPLAGEIRKRLLSELDGLYGKTMAVIRPKQLA